MDALSNRDHGVAPLARVAAKADPRARGGVVDSLEAPLEAALRSFTGAGGAARLLREIDLPWIWFDRGVLDSLAAAEHSPRWGATLADSAAAWLSRRPEVALAMNASALTRPVAPRDSLRASLALAYWPGRSGDVALVLRKNDLAGNAEKGTTHGSPWEYDRHVPLLALGRGIRHGRSDTPVAPPAIAPTVSALLGIAPPGKCEVAPLKEALAAASQAPERSPSTAESPRSAPARE